MTAQSFESLKQLLMETELFQPLDVEASQGLAKELEEVLVPAGTILFQQGELGDAMFFVLEGRLEIVVELEEGIEDSLGVVGPEEYVGEVSLLTGTPRLKTARAVEDSRCAKLSREAFDRFLRHSSRALMKTMHQRLKRRAQIEMSYRYRPSTKEIIELLSTQPLVSHLGHDELEHIASLAQWVHHPGGEVLIREGGPGDAMYIVVSGRFEVTQHRAHGQDVRIAEIGRGESIGEMALLAETTRSGTVRALRDSELLKFSNANIRQLFTNYPRTVMRIVRLMTKRLHQTSQGMRPPPASQSIVLIPAGDAFLFTPFSELLAQSLESMGSTALIGPKQVDQALGKGTAQAPLHSVEHGRVVRWLGEQEADHQFVLYVCDKTMTPWTRRCLRQADRILFVGHILGRSQHNEIEAQLSDIFPDERTTHREFVMLHPDLSVPPQNTSEWLVKRKVESVHHVCIARSKDFARLARRLAGRAIGLVLGGGGARGFAHIGVLRALQEADIPIDMIGGTSMGALMAAQYAMGWTIEELIKANRKGWVHGSPLGDYTLPILSVIRGNRIINMLQEMFEERCIEDLRIPFFCISTNLSRAEMKVHDRGLVRRSIQASMSIPVMGPPMFDNGELFIDGGIFNNLPADEMRKRCGGKVLLSHVVPQREWGISTDLTVAPSGWKLAWDRINPFSSKPSEIPHIIEVVYRAITLHSAKHNEAMEDLADFTLHPPIAHFKLFGFEAMEPIIEAGYQYAITQIPLIKESLKLS